MKKLFLLAILAMFVVLLQAQSTNIEVKTETVGFWTLDNDTILIDRLDQVIKASVFVPGFSTDSVHLSGCTFTIDGTATNGITIPPGEAAFNIGFDYSYLDSIRIDADDKAWLMLLIKRD